MKHGSPRAPIFRRPSVWRLALFALIGIQLLALASAEARPRRNRQVRSAPGLLEINSMTSGATVEIDGEEVGTLPLPGPLKLAPGKHTLKLSKRGYTEYLDVFQVDPGKTTALDIDLLPFAGILVITSSVEEARVFVDGKFVGTAPIEHEALIGERTVRVSKAGYYDFVATINSIAGGSQSVHAKLKLLPLGSSPYRPKPPPPVRWYERWYVWAGAAGGVVAVTLAVALPIALSNKDPIADFSHDFRWPVP